MTGFEMPSPAPWKTYLGYGYGLGFWPQPINDAGQHTCSLTYLKMTPFVVGSDLTEDDKRVVRLLNYAAKHNKPTLFLNLLSRPDVKTLRSRLSLRLYVDQLIQQTGKSDDWQGAINSAWGTFMPKVDLDRQMRRTLKAVWEVTTPSVSQ